MPPKGTKRAKPASSGKAQEAAEPKTEEAGQTEAEEQEPKLSSPQAAAEGGAADEGEEVKPPPSKRAKKEDAPAKAEANESSKASFNGRRFTRSSKPAQQKDASKIVHALLSDDVFKLLDKMRLDDRGGFNFPRDRLNPFQELVAALMVSKPFSHIISSRAVTELFHDGKLKTPKDIVDMGEKAVLDVLWKAKTLHKDKQATQIIGLAETCQERYSGSGDTDASTLDAIRTEADKDVDAERDAIVSAFKGYGPKTVEIFFRRVQVDWDELYPFADDSTLRAAQRMGLPDDAEGLQRAVADAIGGKGDKAEREKFARVCDVLVYLGLDNKLDAALESV